MAILSSADYPSIRGAIDTTLDAETLPDSILALPIYGGAAEAEAVSELAMPYDEYSAEKRAIIKLAIVLLTAALVLPSVPVITNQKLGDASETRAAINVPERIAQLRSQAGKFLSGVDLTAPQTVNRPMFFTTAPGYRAQAKTPYWGA